MISFEQISCKLYDMELNFKKLSAVESVIYHNLFEKYEMNETDYTNLSKLFSHEDCLLAMSTIQDLVPFSGILGDYIHIMHTEIKTLIKEVEAVVDAEDKMSIKNSKSKTVDSKVVSVPVFNMEDIVKYIQKRPSPSLTPEAEVLSYE